MTNVSLNLNRRDAMVYAQWVRWMLGVEEGPWGPGTAMRAADQLYAQEERAIRRVAKELWRVTRSHIWPKTPREIFRGLRHTRADLDGKLLPWSDDHAGYSGLSYSEDIRVACYFADPGKRGMPAFSLTSNNVLPPNGYILTLNCDGDDILFHWRWLLAVGGLFGISDPQKETPTSLIQQEVTVRNTRTLIQRCHDWQKMCGVYIGDRYPGGVWEPGTPDPYGEGPFGAFDPKVIKGERDGHWLASRVPDRVEEIEQFRAGFETAVSGQPPRLAPQVFTVSARDIMERGLSPRAHQPPPDISAQAPAWRTGYAVGRESRDNPKQIAMVREIIRQRTLHGDYVPTERGMRRRTRAEPGTTGIAMVFRLFARTSKKARAGSVSISPDGNSLYSYGTLIAQKRMQDRLDNVCHVEKRKFTKTTAKHINMAKRALHEAGWKTIEIEFP